MKGIQKNTKRTNTQCSATSMHRSTRSTITGQGLTEYLIIIAMVAVAGIGAASFFGDSVKASFLALGSELTGGENVDMVAETEASRAKAQRDVNTQTTLRNYRN
ncbi:MAG: Flp family type IVb pilin [Granulosicoccus sp.]